MGTPSTTAASEQTPGDQDGWPGLERRCYLLELPAEMLNRIYEEVLVCNPVLWVDPEGVPIDRIREDILTNGRRFQYLTSEPALTRTCRQIRQDTLPIFYGRNIFCDTPVDLCCIKFLLYLTPEKRKMLKSLRIAHWKYYAETFLHIDGGPPGNCAMNVCARLARMKQWLQKNGLELADDALHFQMMLDDASVVWNNKLNRRCELQCCSDQKTWIGRLKTE